MSVDKDEITLTKFSLIYFLGDVDSDLRNLFNEKYTQKYIHKESRNTFLTFGRQLQEKITDRIDDAIKWIKIQLDLMND